MIVYALDPGDTSGYVIANVKVIEDAEGGKNFEIKGILDIGTFRYPNGVLEQLNKAKKADVIVIEDFIVRKPLIGSKIYALRTLGAFESIWPDKCVFQQPSEKVRVPDKMLKTSSLWNSSLHVRDALRHLLIYLYKMRTHSISNVAAQKIRRRMRNLRRP